MTRLPYFLALLSLVLMARPARAQIRAALDELALEGELAQESEAPITEAIIAGLQPVVASVDVSFVAPDGDAEGGELDADLLVSAAVVQLEQLYSVSLELRRPRDETPLAASSLDCPACTWSEALAMIQRAARAAASELPGFVTVTVSPSGATVLVDGEERASGEELLLPPGPHRVEARLEDHAPLSRELSVVAGAQSDVELTLEPGSGRPPTEAPSPGRALRVAGWLTGAAALAALVPGVLWLAIDGQCPLGWDRAGACPEVYDTWAPGLGLTVAGSALLATSIALLVTGLRRRHRPRPEVSLLIAPTASGPAALLRGVF